MNSGNCQKTLLENIKKKLPVREFATGHGFDLKTVAKLALTHELEKPQRFPKAILALLSLDAKFVFQKHYTQVSMRQAPAITPFLEIRIFNQGRRYCRLLKDPSLDGVKNLSERRPRPH